MKEKKIKKVKQATNVKVRALIEERKKRAKKRQESKRLKISDIKHGEGAQVNHLLSRIKAKESQLTFIFVTILFFVILTSLYFVFSSVREPIRYSTIKIGNFEVTFNDREENLGNIVNLTPLIPMSVGEGEKTESYKLKIVNTSARKQSFQLKLMNDVAMIQEDGCSDIQLPGQYIYYQIDAYSPQLLDGSKRSPIFYTGTLESGEIRFIEVRIWVSENLPKEYMNYHYHGKISVKTIETTNS